MGSIISYLRYLNKVENKCIPSIAIICSFCLFSSLMSCALLHSRGLFLPNSQTHTRATQLESNFSIKCKSHWIIMVILVYRRFFFFILFVAITVHTHKQTSSIQNQNQWKLKRKRRWTLRRAFNLMPAHSAQPQYRWINSNNNK